MPMFDTAGPIAARIDLARCAGNVVLVASDRTDTVVEVAPHDPSRDLDVRAAAGTTVTFADGQLVVTAPRQRTWFQRDGSIAVTVELPTGSSVHATSAHGNVSAEGRLGACELMTHYGHLEVEETGPFNARTGAGKITVDHATGPVDVRTGTGAVRLGTVDGSLVVTSSRGGVWIGEATGDLRVDAKGDVSVERAGADVTVKTTAGDLRVADVSAGRVSLKAGDGELEIGVRDGIAVWYDAGTAIGTVRNTLTTTDGPEDAERTVEVRAYTHRGDILIRRADLEA